MNPEGVCVDINECNERNVTMCNENARCLNLEGSYKCECKTNYLGELFFEKQQKSNDNF